MQENMVKAGRIEGAVLGHAVGDALGVPVEFVSRARLKETPITEMRGYGTHDQPPGTWSDDTSLMLCTLENLVQGGDLRSLADKFIAWRDKGYRTPHGVVFDIGGTTDQAISRLKQGVKPVEAGGDSERSNGNGSLMRILPAAFQANLDDAGAITLAHDLSRLTHRHPRSLMACGLFTLLARRLLAGKAPAEAHRGAIRAGREFYIGRKPFNAEIGLFEDFLSEDLAKRTEAEIESSGYVIHTLTAAAWCLLTSDSFTEMVLKAVNLGQDTDTTGGGSRRAGRIGLGKIKYPAEVVIRVSLYGKYLFTG